MASSVIHLAIAKKLEKYFNIKNKYDYYLGSIAPDLSKQIGRTKKESHFLFDTREGVTNIKKFTEKYKYFYKNALLNEKPPRSEFDTKGFYSYSTVTDLARFRG